MPAIVPPNNCATAADGALVFGDAIICGEPDNLFCGVVSLPELIPAATVQVIVGVPVKVTPAASIRP